MQKELVFSHSIFPSSDPGQQRGLLQRPQRGDGARGVGAPALDQGIGLRSRVTRWALLAPAVAIGKHGAGEKYMAIYIHDEGISYKNYVHCDCDDTN